MVARNTCYLKPLPPILEVPVRRLWKQTVVAINHSDPGAVPGASTKAHQWAGPESGLWRGRNRIDEGVKGVLFLGIVPPLSGYAIVANDNFAPVAQAA